MTPSSTSHRSLPHESPPAAPGGRSRTARRALAAALTVVLGAALPGSVVAGPAQIDTDYQGSAPIDTSYDDGTGGRASELTRRGQAAFDAGDYLGAAAAWKQLLQLLPENEFNRQKRQNAVLIALEAYKQAFRRITVEQGSVTETAAQLLRDALGLCDVYTKEARRVHGETAVSPAVVESRVEIEGMLLDAGFGLAGGGDGGNDDSGFIADGDDGGFIEDDDGGPRPPTGIGLIAAGSASIAVGLGMMPLVIIGARRLGRANADIRQANSDGDDEAARAAEDRGRSANAMLISGSILMGLLTVGGATMLGIGIKRRIRYTAFSPVMGPSYVGVSLRRRF
ncbi:MAG: hypothetical protein AAGF11_33620 [Myxococcota bacterium]